MAHENINCWLTDCYCTILPDIMQDKVLFYAFFLRNITSAMHSVALRLLSSIMWEYTSVVMLVLAWPNIFETVTISIPLEIMTLAKLCLRLCGLMNGKPYFFENLLR